LKKLLLSSTCFVIVSTAAMAADLRLPVKAPIAAAPAFSWTGCYVGAHAGGSMTHSFAATNFEGAGSSSDNGTGAVAGGQVGCNYQAGNWVFGVEGEGSWSNSKATNSLTFSPVALFSPTAGERLTTKNNNDFSITGRAGIAFDRTLIYGKGGWVWGSFDHSSTFTCCDFLGVPSFTSASSNLNGFLVGAGIEHALTRNWTIKFEYNYLDFGSRVSNVGVTPGGVPVNVTESPTKQILKVGANYLFDFGKAPVFAKY
jgi:outer membrane immunogenic protein